VRRSTKVWVLAALLALGSVSGCAVGQPRQFTARANQLCADVSRSVSNLQTATEGVEAMRWSMTRYTDMEHLVAQLTDDTNIPGGATGEELRNRWLRPARASLVTGRDDLEDLRQAIHHDPATVEPALTASLRAGADGVDTAYLARVGLLECAVAFTATQPTQ
jgi:outer membrane murein-binding lipoprotein Lpp